ncbi:C4-dicarboxylate transporter/malic acid transport protein [Cupriavidus necator N-1]|uniref:C4-dicarboxylate transporter/malic acid transport protein n=1 Tax=Cupriavidus necator (strain ATCC 43291 / DSM 13513 / CCUG 52238 / LMG 8453 / N-1) TaxID=1042878 RepID=G0EXL6_CUPNN|nr:SLAC1 anion channel family protein [Cupriavidus necator]AEI76121.1 C4-dicarboxylate transporter/malic acid transport protein [Cupriavidus necator N-1]MDX6011751.1 SLAC1 anion channel family protein [Cupriavidus necator]
MTLAAHPAATLPAPRSSVKHLPVNLFGAVMGLSGLSMAWRGAGSAFGVSPVIGNAVGVVAVLAFLALAAGYLAKWLRYPDAVRAEFSHPVAGNFFGTIAIAILLLSSVVSAHHETLGQMIWTLGTVITVGLTFVIAGRLLHGRTEAANVVPAWLIPGVATLDIAVAGGTMPMAWAHEVNLLAVGVGTVIALVFFTMIISRLIHHDPLPAGMVPSLIILIAPFEVGFLAYVNMTGSVDMFAGMLFYFGLFLFLLLSWRVFRRPAPFAPSWWAISFPMAALSNAALKYAGHEQSAVLAWLAGLILLVLTTAIVVLFVRTLHSLFTHRLLAA